MAQEIKVIGPNKFECFPGGLYELGQDNHTEEAIARLRLLQHIISKCTETWANIGECPSDQIVYAKEIDALAKDVFALYKTFIEVGIDIFDYSEYEVPKQIAIYNTRPIVCGGMNPAEGESPEVLPGWWYEYPGYAYRFFQGLGKVVVSFDTCIQIGFYEIGKEDNCIDMLEISNPFHYGLLFQKCPDHAVEIAAACKAVEAECKCDEA